MPSSNLLRARSHRSLLRRCIIIFSLDTFSSATSYQRIKYTQNSGLAQTGVSGLFQAPGWPKLSMTGYAVFRFATRVMGFTRDNQERSDAQKSRVERRIMRRQGKNKRKLQELGIEYDVDAVAYVGSAPLSNHLMLLIILMDRKSRKCSRAVTACRAGGGLRMVAYRYSVEH
jgi:hypothetical protein